MLKMTSALGLALALLAGGLTMPDSGANAQDLELHIGKNGIEPRIRDRGDDYDRDRGRDHDRDRDHDHDRDRDRDHRRGCDPDEAMDAARDEGFRHPHVVRMNDRRIVVEGRTRHGPDRIVFANRRGCPEIR